MYNNQTFNTTPYNSRQIPTPESGSESGIGFNGFDLQTDKIIISSVNIDRMPTLDFPTVRRPRTDGRIISGHFWDVKTVNLIGNIDVSTRIELDDLIDEIKKNISVQEGFLDIKRGDGTSRRFIATLINGDFQRDRHFHISTCPIFLSFQCLTPFGQALSYHSDLIVTSFLNITEAVDNIGTANARPVFIIVVDAANSVTGINIKNNTTNEEIEITENINSGDVIRFDSESRIASINGFEVDYDGSFPKLETGVNSYTIKVIGNSMTYSITVKYLPLYL